VNFPKAEEIAGAAFDTDSKELGTFKDADLAAQALLDQQSNNPHRPTNSGAGKGIGAEDGNPTVSASRRHPTNATRLSFAPWRSRSGLAG
jgi:hypothetical protein